MGRKQWSIVGGVGLAVLMLGLAASAIPASLEVSPILFQTKNAATAAWSGTKVNDGSLSAYLKTTGGVGAGDEGRIVVPLDAGTTLNDLTTISWWQYVVAGYSPHVDIIVDVPGGTDALVVEYAYNDHVAEGQPTYGTLTGTWYQTFSDDGNGPAVINDAAYAWLSSGPAGGAGIIGDTLGNWKAGGVTGDPHGISGTTPVLRLEIEIDNWIAQSEAYIDTIAVNGTTLFGQIQDAVDAAAAADTINVAAGTYNEDLAIGKALTLQGAGAATTEIACQHTITASGVTMDGFTFTVGGNETAITIDTSGAAIANTTITNNIFNMTTGPAVGIYLGGRTPTNKVSDVGIFSNTFNGPTTKDCNPWKIGGWFGTGLSCDVENVDFVGNTVDSCSIPVNLQNAHIKDVLIHNNTFTNTDGVVYIWTQGAGATGAVSRFVFSSNTVDDSNTYGVAFGIGNGTLTPANFGAGNRVTGNHFGEGISGGYGLDAVTSMAGGYLLDATGNWWGDVTGPYHATTNAAGQGCDVSDDVDYSPWWGANYVGDAHATPWTWGTNDSIQDAIDVAAAGDTINVAAGTYNEDLAIGKALTLQGAGAATTEIACQHTITASGVTMDGFTFTVGDNETGITIDTSGAAIANTTITNSTFDMASGPAVGIYLGGGTPTNKVSSVVINDNTFNGPAAKNCNPWKVGGWFGTGLSCEVENVDFERNTVDSCSIPVNLQDADIKDVYVHDNTFTNTDGVVYIWTQGAGATGAVSDFVFAGNAVDGTNTYGVAFGIGNGTLAPANFGAGNWVRYNEFGAGIPGGYGLDAVTSMAGGYLLDATHNWWGHDSGPYHPTTNATGQGCRVSDDVDYTPWIQSTVTETTTETVTDDTVTLPSGDGSATVTGTAEVTVAKYDGNPTGSGFGSGEIGYIDVYVPDTSGATEIEIRMNYPAETNTATLKLHWWDGGAWVECSNQGVNTAGGYVWAKITASSTPNLTQLQGTIFGGGSGQPASTLLFEDFESDTSGWTFGTGDNLWHLTTEADVPSLAYANLTAFPSSDHAAWFGKPTAGSYSTKSLSTKAVSPQAREQQARIRPMATGGFPQGALISPSFGVSGVPSVKLQFRYYREVECYPQGSYDRTYVQASFDGSTSWQSIGWSKDSKDCTGMREWLSSGEVQIPVPAGAATMQVRFVFNAVDSVANNFLGWLIDDVRVSSEGPSGLRFQEENLGEGVVGEVYSAIIHPVGGTAPYNWRVVAQPAWLTEPSTTSFQQSTCTLSGTPTAGNINPGYEVTLAVSDARGQNWQQTYYIKVEDAVEKTVYWFDDLEGSVAGWTTSGLWHLTGNTPCVSPPYASPTHVYYYGKDATCTYVTSGANSGTLTSPAIGLGGITSGSKLTVGWKYWRDVETYASGAYDQSVVEISFDGGATWTRIWYDDSKQNEPMGGWHLVEATDYTPGAGGGAIVVPAGATSILIRFVFDTVDGYANNYVGWLIDDVKAIQQTAAAGTLAFTTTCSDTDLPDGAVGMAYNAQLSASDGVLPYTYAWTADVIPGLTLDTATGAITGAPTAAGTYDCEFSVTDAATNVATLGPCSVDIAAAPACSCDLAAIDFENGVGGSLVDDILAPAAWTVSSLWHLAKNGCVTCLEIIDNYAYFGIDDTCTYNDAAHVVGYLTSPAIPVEPCVSDVAIVFDHFREVENYTGWYDRTFIQVRWDGGSWDTVWMRGALDPSPDCEQLGIGPIPVVGSQLEVRFGFDSIDSMFNDFIGWAVDNIAIKNYACSGPCIPPMSALKPTREARDEFTVLNIPNPVRDVHTTTFTVRGEGIEAIKIQIFDIDQQLIYEEEIDGDQLVWHTVNDYGEYLANGIYFYRASVRKGGVWMMTQFEKLVILR